MGAISTAEVQENPIHILQPQALFSKYLATLEVYNSITKPFKNPDKIITIKTTTSTKTTKTEQTNNKRYSKDIVMCNVKDSSNPVIQKMMRLF